MSIESLRLEHRCRICSAARPGGRGPFAVPGARPHFAPDLPVRLEHLALECAVHPQDGWLKGTVTQRIRVVSPEGVTRLKLDQIGIQVSAVRVGGETARYGVEGNSLWVELPKAAALDEKLELAIDYRVERSRRGLYFTGPTPEYPSKPHEVWSQGQDEDTRWWIPTFDYPNQKATWEIAATVPKGFRAVSNGALVSEAPAAAPGGKPDQASQQARRDAEGGWTRYHYKLGTAHVTYLISLVVGEFEHWEDKGPRGLPVPYYVAKGRVDDGKRAFGNTPRMLEAFEARTGVPYPYEKYSQVAVQDFLFGGMENVSATTQTDAVLHDAKAHRDFSGDPLVSHELAHQWFGDLVTCRDWSHGWLNEGFATFMERVWIEENTADYGSREKAAEEARYYSSLDLKEHREEDGGKYRRPIVCNTYVEPIDLFDTHLYQKGGLVLNLVRSQLGEAPFWRAVKLYLERHRGGSVETLDLVRAIEDATGRNLRALFEQWVFQAGYPELEISYQWHDDRKLVELVIEQKQTGGQPEKAEHGAVTPVFRLDVPVEIACEGGAVVRRTVALSELRDRVFLEVPAKPRRVRFDPGSNVPKALKFPRPKELLLAQLAEDPDCMGRIEAALELTREASLAGADVVKALGERLLSDPFWGVQAEIAARLAEVRGPAAREALTAGLAVKHPKARRAVVEALGSFRGDQMAAERLRMLGEKDDSYFVEAAAVTAYSKARLKPDAKADSPEVLELESWLLARTKQASFHEVVAAAAFGALATLPGTAEGRRASVVEALLLATRSGKPYDLRTGAILALGRLARVAVEPLRSRLFGVFDSLADEDDFRLRRRLVAALGGTELPEAAPILRKIERIDLDGRIRRDARSNAQAAEGAGEGALARLTEKVTAIEEENRKLRAWVEEKLGAPRA